MMKIEVEYEEDGKSVTTTLDVESDSSVEEFAMQLYSLTSIPPQEQALTGLNEEAARKLHNAAEQEKSAIATLGLKDGQKISVKKKQSQSTGTTTPLSTASTASTAATAAPTPDPATSAPASTQAPPSATELMVLSMCLQQCCSRSFFGEEALMQPSALAANGEKAVCMTCAQTCNQPNTLRPRLSSRPFVCGCASIPNHECLFSARSLVAADALPNHGPTRDQARTFMSVAARQMIDSQLSKGKEDVQRRITSQIREVMTYENPLWQEEARKVIPIERLQRRAQELISSGESKLDIRDELMNQLLSWFKGEFFKWVNNAPCDTCGSESTQGIGGTRPNASEASFGAGIVELYRCPSGHITRFPRYNHALKLLSTRRGRCGEWVQAFMLCCRALGYETRNVHDYTDHVWVEYFSEDRWIHCDPCEARRDAPLLYEQGWGKKLTYTIAASKEEVIDVTRRYTKQWHEVEERRTMCPESWLQSYLASLTQMQFMAQSPARQAELLRRRTKERAELDAQLQPQSASASATSSTSSPASSSSAAAAVKEEEHQGRTTGSVEWRVQRGELGADEIARQRALQPELINKSPASSSTATATATATAAPSKAAASVAAGTCSTQPTADKLASLSLTPSTTSTDSTVSSSSSTSSSSSSSSSSVAPAPQTPPSSSSTPAASAVSDIAAAKERTKLLFQRYLIQLQRGCGVKDCSTSKCKSNPSFQQLPSTDVKEIAKLALELTKQGTKDVCPNLNIAAKQQPSSSS